MIDLQLINSNILTWPINLFFFIFLVLHLVIGPIGTSKGSFDDVS